MTEALIRSGIDVPQNVLKIVCMIIVTILLSYVSLLFGELVPRRLGMKNPDELSLRLAGLLKIAMIAVWPATALLTVTANGVLYLMGIKPEEKEEQATEEEIRMLLTEGNEQGSIQQEESEIAVIERFLPAQLSDEEASAKIREIVSELGASSMKDMGRVMATVKERLGTSIEPARASALVKGALA